MSLCPIGGRLGKFLGNWRSLTSCHWTLQTVQGYHLEFVSRPPYRSPPQNPVVSKEQEEILDSEVETLLLKQAILKTELQEGFFSSIFLVPKKDGGWRPIINLKDLNQYLQVQHFKMETNSCLKDVVRKDEWFGKIDLKDAYLTVLIHGPDQKYLKFMWKHQPYQFRALPFGLATAPRVFSKIMKPLVAQMREKAMRLLQYLDDILVMADSPRMLKSHLQLVMSNLQEMGFVLNEKKCQTEPSQTIECLGFLVDSRSLMFFLPQEKILKVKKECRRMMNNHHPSVLEGDTHMCPVSTLRQYLDRTKVFRKGSNGHPLFLAVRKPHGGVSSSTVSRWLRNMLGHAGIDTEKF